MNEGTAMVLANLGFLAWRLGMAEFTRRAPGKISLAVWIILPLLFTAHVHRELDKYGANIFFILKYYSAIIPTILLCMMRSWPQASFNRLFGYYVMPAVVIINLIEATLFIFPKGHGATFTGVGGLLLIFTLFWPRSKGPMLVQTDTPYYDAPWDLGPYWVWAYNVWMFPFFYHLYPYRIVDQAVVLACPMVLCLQKDDTTGSIKFHPNLWIQYRTYSLASDLFMRFAVFLNSPYLINMQGLENDTAKFVFHSVNFVGCVAIFAYEYVVSSPKKKDD